ncbi:MAG: hypothetical protein R3F61_38490 [Myxococcota bacterium]
MLLLLSIALAGWPAKVRACHAEPTRDCIREALLREARTPDRTYAGDKTKRPFLEGLVGAVYDDGALQAAAVDALHRDRAAQLGAQWEPAVAELVTVNRVLGHPDRAQALSDAAGLSDVQLRKIEREVAMRQGQLDLFVEVVEHPMAPDSVRSDVAGQIVPHLVARGDLVGVASLLVHLPAEVSGDGWSEAERVALSLYGPLHATGQSTEAGALRLVVRSEPARAELKRLEAVRLADPTAALGRALALEDPVDRESAVAALGVDLARAGKLDASLKTLESLPLDSHALSRSLIASAALEVAVTANRWDTAMVAWAALDPDSQADQALWQMERALDAGRTQPAATFLGSVPFERFGWQRELLMARLAVLLGP